MEEKENKTKTIQIRVSESEYEIIQMAAKAHFLDIGPFVRSQILMLITADQEVIQEG